MKVHQHVHCNCRPFIASSVPHLDQSVSAIVKQLACLQVMQATDMTHNSRLPEEASYKASSRQTVVSAVMHNQSGSLLQPLWVLQELKHHGGNAAFLHATAQGSRSTRILHSKSSSVQTKLRQKAVDAMSCTVSHTLAALLAALWGDPTMSMVMQYLQNPLPHSSYSKQC